MIDFLVNGRKIVTVFKKIEDEGYPIQSARK